MSRPSIAFVTTCKGRLHHIKQTLPLIIAQKPDEIIVVDYDCPDRVGDWVEENFSGVKVVRVVGDAGFCLAKARNIGAMNTHASWICFIDADVKISPGWMDWLRQHLKAEYFYIRAFIEGRNVAETSGTVCCSRRAFEVLGGYDEIFRGWGGEDTDFYSRLKGAGYRRAHYPAHYVVPLEHQDEERVQFHEVKNIGLQNSINGYYARIKKACVAFTGQPLTLPIRASIMDQVKSQLQLAAKINQEFPAVTVILDTTLLHPDSHIQGRIEFVLNKQRKFFGLFGKTKWKLSQRVLPNNSE